MEKHTVRFQELYIVLSYLCNAECDHCYVSSSPRGKGTKLDRDVIFKTIDQSREIDQIAPKIAIAGGEPTLFWDDLLAVINYSARNNYQVILMSNGWWGKSKECCAKKLEELIENGLTRLEISSGTYHRKYIHPSAVNNIIRLCQGQPIELAVHVRNGKSDSQKPGEDFLDGCPVEIVNIPVMPTGRAAVKIDPGEFIYSDGLPRGNCRQDLSFLITPGADCYPCCGGSELNRFFFLGNIKEENLRDIIARFNRRRLLHILTQKGPAYIAGALKSDGFTQVGEDGHVGICDLCYRIFQPPVLAAAAERWANSPDSLNAYRQSQKELPGLVEPVLRELPFINPDKLDENLFRRVQRQPSGTFLLPVENYYLKVAPSSSPAAKKVLAQASWLEHNRKHGIRCIPDVLFKFSRQNGITGYVMPRYCCNTPAAKLDTTARVKEILQCLETIWDSPIPSSSPRVIDWNGYVLKVEKILSRYNRELARIFGDLGIRVGGMKDFKKSYNVHGDPTFENLVYDRGGNVILLDPNPQYEPAVPIPELDAAKVMQSACGWEDFIYGRTARLHWNRDLQPIVSARFGSEGWPVCAWLLISHLVRTLPYGANIGNPYGLISSIKHFLYSLREDMPSFH